MHKMRLNPQELSLMSKHLFKLYLRCQFFLQMRVQLVVLCVVVLCLMATMAGPLKRGRGRKGGR